MPQRRIIFSAAVALSSLVLAGTVYAVYTGNLNLLYEDPNDKFDFTVTTTIPTEEAAEIENNWQAGLKPGESVDWSKYLLTGKSPYRINLQYKWETALADPAKRFEIADEYYTGIRNLSRFYRMEMQSPETRYYNLIDDRYAALISKAQFDAGIAELRKNYGEGPWNYSGDYDPYYDDDYSSYCDPPYYLTGGVGKYFEIINGGRVEVIPRVQVSRITLNYANDSYAQRASIPILEGENYVPVASWNIPRYVVTGPANGANVFQDSAWKNLNYTKIGTDWALTTGINYKPKVDFRLSSNHTLEYDSPFKAAVTPDDPLFASSGSWKQSYADQWALKRVGFKPLEDPTSAWHLTTGTERPVVVAVIDSGIDLTHPDLHINNIWKNNKETAGNRRDDDGNGYIDDLIGWNFVQNNNNPFDFAGHGTHVAGLIAARWNNGRGIAGINRGVRIMALKALNEIGKGWGSDIARAVVYAVDNGAKVINISAEHQGQTRFLEKAFAYAQDKGALVVVSAGNEASDTTKVEPANQPGTLVVAATLPNDKRVGFSNWGQKVNMAAPGVDVLSLRAHGTDLVRKVATDPSKIKPGEAVVGKDEQYYRASGTSFAAPLVSGVASLMLAKNPNLTAEQIKRMLMMSADDIEAPGWDPLTGYGMLNARKALEADPNYYLYTELHRMGPAKEGNQVVLQAYGTVGGSDWGEYRIEIGEGENPAQWRRAGKTVGGQVKEGLLATLAPQDFGKPGRWTVRIVAQDAKGRSRESRLTITLQ